MSVGDGKYAPQQQQNKNHGVLDLGKSVIPNDERGRGKGGGGVGGERVGGGGEVIRKFEANHQT